MKHIVNRMSSYFPNRWPLSYLKLFDPVLECVFDLDFSCKFSKLQYNSLAFLAGFKRATDEGSLPEIVQYSPYYLPLNVFTVFKGSNLYILFGFTGMTYLLQSFKHYCLFQCYLRC